jgi:hypothetical protein
MATSISLRNPNVSLGTCLSTIRLTPRRSSNATVRLLREPMAGSSPPLSTAAPSAAVETVSAGERPDRYGRFGRFGGKYVPETLMYALSELETAFEALSKDPEFQVCVCARALLLGCWNIEKGNSKGKIDVLLELLFCY